MISAVCMGGHWKRIDKMIGGARRRAGWPRTPRATEFHQNRDDVVSRCIERGINYIDACIREEVMTYAKALKGRRDKMYLGFSWCEVRDAQRPSAATLQEAQAVASTTA